jgi:hypothetical protein
MFEKFNFLSQPLDLGGGFVTDIKIETTVP